MPFSTELVKITDVDNIPRWRGYGKTGIVNNRRWECKLVPTSSEGSLVTSIQTNNVYMCLFLVITGLTSKPIHVCTSAGVGIR